MRSTSTAFSDGAAISDLSPPRWEHFPHGADIGIHGFGPTPARAFEQTAPKMQAHS